MNIFSLKIVTHLCKINKQNNPQYCGKYYYILNETTKHIEYTQYCFYPVVQARFPLNITFHLECKLKFDYNQEGNFAQMIWKTKLNLIILHPIKLYQTEYFQ